MYQLQMNGKIAATFEDERDAQMVAILIREHRPENASAQVVYTPDKIEEKPEPAAEWNPDTTKEEPTTKYVVFVRNDGIVAMTEIENLPGRIPGGNTEWVREWTETGVFGVSTVSHIRAAGVAIEALVKRIRYNHGKSMSLVSK